MPTRSSTSEFQPIPPWLRLAGKQNGRFSAGMVIKTASTNPGVKPNVGAPPTTNGDRAAGLAPSQPASAKAQKGMRARLSR